MRHYKTLLATGLTALAALSLGLSSCDDEPLTKPKAPTDETLNKNHDMPTKVELTLFRGHFHGIDFHANAPLKQTPKYYNSIQQTITLESTPEGFKPAEGSQDKFVVQGGINTTDGKMPVDPETANWTDETFNPGAVQAGIQVYGLIIKLYRADGTEITGEFATPEESKIHQFFFIPEEIKPTKFRSPEAKPIGEGYNYFYYYYMDTDPWDTTLYAVGKEMDEKGATEEEKKQAIRKAFKGISNPIGLKGFTEFYETETECVLNVKLMHAKISKYLDNGKTSPFYKPSKQQNARDDWNDLNIKIPVVVFASMNEYLEADEFDQMTDADKLFVKKLADAYNISEEEAFEDLWIYTNAGSEGHSLDAGIHL